jgi:tetratricopeptide (TPR) repeat protein
VHLAVEAVESRQYTEALGLLEKAVDLDPWHQRAQFLRCVCLYHLGEYRSAIPACDRAARIDPGNPNIGKIYSRRGSAYFQLGAYRTAIEDYDRAIMADPFDWRTLANRAAAWKAVGDLTIAEKDLEKAVELNPEEPRLRSLLKETRQQWYREPGRSNAQAQTLPEPDSQVKPGWGIDKQRGMGPSSPTQAEIFSSIE